MYNNSLTIIVSSLLFGVMLSGCLGFGFKEECDLPSIEGPQDNSRPAISELSSKWRPTYESLSDEGGSGVDSGVIALRTSPPNAPYSTPEDEPQPATTKYVDWRQMPMNSKPEILHDLLCVSEWRREQVPTFSSVAYGTYTGVGNSIYNEAIDTLKSEFLRQNRQFAPDEWCCYVLYNGEFYAPATREAIGTPVS